MERMSLICVAFHPAPTDLPPFLPHSAFKSSSIASSSISTPKHSGIRFSMNAVSLSYAPLSPPSPSLTSTVARLCQNLPFNLTITKGPSKPANSTSPVIPPARFSSLLPKSAESSRFASSNTSNTFSSVRMRESSWEDFRRVGRKRRRWGMEGERGEEEGKGRMNACAVRFHERARMRRGGVGRPLIIKRGRMQCKSGRQARQSISGGILVASQGTEFLRAAVLLLIGKEKLIQLSD